VARNENMARRWIETPGTFMIIRRTKMDARERARHKFVRSGGSDIWKT
jgi:hypothetical protein